MHRLVVANMKGGVGKTTTALHLAAGLARRGQRVLLVDTDPQGNLAHCLGCRPIKTLRDLLTSDAPVASLLLRDVLPHLDLLAANTDCFRLESELAGLMQRETLLDRRLRPLAGYDVLLLDSSPAMSLLTLNALLAADDVLIPVGMDSMALIGARQTLNGLGELQNLWGERAPRLLGILPTAVNPSTVATRAALVALQGDAAMAHHVIHPGIRQCIDLTYAAAAHVTIWDHAPRSRAAEDYTALVDTVLRRWGADSTEAKPGHGQQEQAHSRLV